MNYRHIYHAGNFADVFKHWIYSLLLSYTKKKEKPFSVIDTHAGLGHYNLTSEQANKTNEYQTGILKLMAETNRPESFKPYLDIVISMNQQKKIRRYPGSPYLISQFLSPADKLHACELHPDDFKVLQNNFYNTKNIHCHNINGYHSGKALLPFPQKRGLIFIDPPFEKNDEFQQIINYLNLAITRFRQGIFAIWFPIKNYQDITSFYNKLKKLPIDNLLIAELVINDIKVINQLNGCGMVIINPTWQLDEILNKDLPFLCDLFSLSSDAYSQTRSKCDL